MSSSKDAAKAKVQKLIDEHAVVLFGKSWCGYCVSSRKLLNSLGAVFEDLNLDQMSDGDEIQAALRELTGQSTVPNIFINKKHIGGNSDLQAMGNLKQVLQDAKALK